MGRPARPRAGRSRCRRPRLPRGGDRARAGARDRADGRLGGRGRRGRRTSGAAAASCAARAATATPSRGSPSSSTGRSPRRSWPVPEPTTPRPGTRSSRSPSGSAARSGRSPSAPGPGFRRTTRMFAGHLPADRQRLRETLAPYDVVLVVGGPAFRQYAYHAGPFVEPGHGSPWSARIRPRCTGAPPSSRCSRILRRSAPSSRGSSRRGSGARSVPFARPAPPAPPAAGEPLRAGHVLDALAERLPRNAIVIEECPVEPAGAARPPAGARAARFAEPGDGRARVRAPGCDRAAHGAAPSARSSRSSATARRSTRSSRSGAPRTIASARCS